MSQRRKVVPARRRPVSTSREGAVVVAGIGCILALVYNAVSGMVVVAVALLIWGLDFAGRRRTAGTAPAPQRRPTRTARAFQSARARRR